MEQSLHGRTDFGANARTLSGHELAQAMRESRACTLSRVADLSDAQWSVPRQQGVNPIAWELAHLAWFAEFWILRGPHHRSDDGFAQGARGPLHTGPDALFDSARLPHAARWDLQLARHDVMDMLHKQLEACVDAIPDEDSDEALYFHRLALFHEDMHAEAFAWLRSTLAYPAPAGVKLEAVVPREAVKVQGGDVRIGSAASAPGFSFDNEWPLKTVQLSDFEIDATPVTAGDFLHFVMDGGYDNPRHWPGDAGRWRASVTRSHPARWRRSDPSAHEHAAWQVRWFDHWRALDPLQPVIHVNAWEAQAYCLWAGRRLPRAAEWEHAADRIDWGDSVWEWTADDFEPYPGFEPGPYREYSAPWFDNHRELRGGAFATSQRMHHRRYRNFFTPERSDVFAGFRTALL